MMFKNVLWVEVDSSAVKKIKWQDGVLYAQYADNANIYGYRNVPEKVYFELLVADSVGSYFNTEIKTNPKYESFTMEMKTKKSTSRKQKVKVA